MKKQLRCILLLALCIIGLCLVPVTANAEGENPIELTQNNYKSHLGVSGNYNQYYLPFGSYILTEDITLEETLRIGYDGQIYDENFSDVNVTLDLNGYVLRQGNAQPFPVIQVYQGSTLTIQDSRPDAIHKFTANSTGLWYLDEANGDKTVNGGVITGSVKTGLVLQAVDTNKPEYIARCTMNGGNIVGCTYSSYGGGVCVGDKAEFTMNAGSIRGCTVTDTQHGYGGGVYVVGGTFSMNGGTISDCVSATADGGDALFLTNGINTGNSSFSMSANATINGSFTDDNLGASEGSAGVYTVTFESDGGTEVPPQVRPKDATAIKPDDPTKDNLFFDGWYDGDSVYNFTEPVTANLMLKAKWTQDDPSSGTGTGTETGTGTGTETGANTGAGTGQPSETADSSDTASAVWGGKRIQRIQGLRISTVTTTASRSTHGMAQAVRQKESAEVTQAIRKPRPSQRRLLSHSPGPVHLTSCLLIRQSLQIRRLPLRRRKMSRLRINSVTTSGYSRTARRSTLANAPAVERPARRKIIPVERLRAVKKQSVRSVMRSTVRLTRTITVS